MPLEVIGAGFGRTGTLSLKRALEMLGVGPTYHMEEVIRHPSHIRRWLLYSRTNTIDWETVFADYRSAVDFPISCVWKELAARYPDAKVVLTVRDPQAWWESTASTIYRVRTMFPKWFVRLVPIAGWYLDDGPPRVDRPLRRTVPRPEARDRSLRTAPRRRDLHVSTGPARRVRRGRRVGTALRVPGSSGSAWAIPTPERRQSDAPSDRGRALGHPSSARDRNRRRRGLAPPAARAVIGAGRAASIHVGTHTSVVRILQGLPPASSSTPVAVTPVVTDDRHHQSGDVRSPWTGREILMIVGVQAAGLAVSFIGFWFALFGLPPDGLGGENDLGTRTLGVGGALACAGGLSAGCWEVWRRRRHVVALLGGLCVVAVVAIVAVGWALQLG